VGNGDTIQQFGPSAVNGGLSFRTISAGALHTCGLSTNDVAYCWGSNRFGQLGRPIERVATPTPVNGLTGVGTLALGPNSSHTCALTGTGSAFCWGNNNDAELGNNSTQPASAVPDSVYGGRAYRTISPGLSHTCAVTTAGTGYCWGDNGLSQLGIGSSGGLYYQPAPVAGGLTFTSIASGLWHTCGLTTSGAGYCWGANVLGEIGDSSTTFRQTPVPVSGGLTFSAIATGVFISCGLVSTGSAYCWGANSGQFGDSSNANSLVPKPAASGLALRTLTIGAGHVCGLVSSGAAYCWGANESGQLGNGSMTRSLLPTRVSGGLNFTAISAGGGHTCGLTNAGVAYCWGGNNSGELGTGPNGGTNVPVAVSGGFTFTAIEAGAAYSCAVTSAGTAYCWGDDYYGQLGRGALGFVTQPVAVAP